MTAMYIRANISLVLNYTTLLLLYYYYYTIITTIITIILYYYYYYYTIIIIHITMWCVMKTMFNRDTDDQYHGTEQRSFIYIYILVLPLCLKFLSD